MRDKSKVKGVSLPESLWAAIDRHSGGWHGGCSKFIARAVSEALARDAAKKKSNIKTA
jgi:hypothetical protein